ncbi:hypothetical protein ONZ45_g2680 [Pleurotus djamor]|nr:hypothetical protein ONZ45_g2680 [Pleurotus djamor]
MYSDKIAYANKYVPHANRALRSFNMFLNVRKPPLRSKLGFNPLQFFFPRPDPPVPTPTDSAPASPPQSPIPTRSISRSRSTPMPISPIPPSTNPRGELIFSSRVDQNFRESYEKYRATFERHKLEKDNLARMQRGWFGVSWLRLNHPRITRHYFWRKASEVVESGIPRSPEKLVGSSPLVRTPTGTSTRSSKGGSSRSGTPPSTPKHVSKQRDRSSSRTRTPGTRQSTPARQSTPPVSPSPSRHGSTRGRRDLGGKDKDGGLSGEGTELNLRAFALEKSALHNIGE